MSEQEQIVAVNLRMGLAASTCTSRVSVIHRRCEVQWLCSLQWCGWLTALEWGRASLAHLLGLFGSKKHLAVLLCSTRTEVLLGVRFVPKGGT